MTRKKSTTAADSGVDVAERMMALFDGYALASGTHGMPKRDPNGLKWSIKETAKTLNTGPTLEMWQRHLAGTRPLGVVCIREDSTCIWGSIDIDKYNIDHMEVIALVESMKLPLVPCRSKSNGLHLFMFCSEPVAANLLQLALRNLAAVLGFADSEIFPKQTHIKGDQGDSGSWMVMPYYGDTFGGKLRLQYGLKKTGAEMTVEEFIAVAEKSRVSEETIVEIRGKSIAEEKPKRGGGASKRPFGDGPPCLQFMSESGFPDGGRNNALVHMGVYLKKAFPANWKEMLVDSNQKYMRPPLPAEEVVGVQRQLEKRDYEYLCKHPPMANHCDSVTCRMRRYGVGNEAYPEILATRKLMTEPAVWFVDVMGSAGTVTLKLATDQFMNYSRFQQACMEYATVINRALSQNQWTVLLQDAINKAELIEAPPDTSIGGHFHELLERYLTNRQSGQRKEDVLRHVPWLDEENGRYWFSIDGLTQFLTREGWRENGKSKVDRNDVAIRIRYEHGSKDPTFQPREFWKIKGVGRNVWWVPASAVQKMPDIDPPEMPREKL